MLPAPEICTTVVQCFCAMVDVGTTLVFLNPTHAHTMRVGSLLSTSEVEGFGIVDRRMFLSVQNVY